MLVSTYYQVVLRKNVQQRSKKTKAMKNSNTYLGILIVALVFVAGSTIAAPAPPVPDIAGTSGLFATALVGLVTVKRFFRR
jgi:hypothetical protein